MVFVEGNSKEYNDKLKEIEDRIAKYELEVETENRKVKRGKEKPVWKEFGFEDKDKFSEWCKENLKGMKK